MNIKISTALIMGLTMLHSCKHAASPNSEVKTNFGPEGNAKVTSTFLEYVKKNQHCDNSGTGLRVLVTGFGQFSSAPRNKRGELYNFSGVVARGFTDEIWPKKTDNLSAATVDPQRAKLSYARTSQLPAAQQGGYAEQVSLNINGKEVVVCTLLLDVVWDQSAAIIAYETSRFFPDKILMVGLNNSVKTTAILEIGAVNAASISSGFTADGEKDLANTPKATLPNERKIFIVPSGKNGISSMIDMSWGAHSMALAMNTYASQIRMPGEEGRPFSARAAPAVSEINTFILNNVAFIVANATLGKTMELAGGSLVLGTKVDPSHYDAETTVIALDPRLVERVKSVGLIQLPDVADDSGKMVYGWLKALANAMITADTPALKDFVPEDIPQVSMTKVYGYDTNASVKPEQTTSETSPANEVAKPVSETSPTLTPTPVAQSRPVPFGNQKKISPVVPKKTGTGTNRVLGIATYTGEGCPIQITATRSSKVHNRMTSIDMVLGGDCGGKFVRVNCDSNGFCGPVESAHIDLNEGAPNGFNLVNPEKTVSYTKQ